MRDPGFMSEKLDKDSSPERRAEKAEAPKPTPARTEDAGSQADGQAAVIAAVRAEFLAADTSGAGDRGVERPDRIHSRYPDGVEVHEGEQPKKVQGPDPAADGAPHTVLKMDEVNRPDHTAPEQHRYTPNDPDNPKAGYKRGPGEPLDS